MQESEAPGARRSRRPLEANSIPRARRRTFLRTGRAPRTRVRGASNTLELGPHPRSLNSKPRGGPGITRSSGHPQSASSYHDLTTYAM